MVPVWVPLPCRLLDKNPSARLMWRSFCGAEEVGFETFVLAIAQFMKEFIKMDDADVTRLLTSRKAALLAAVDSNGDGKVRASHVHMSLPLPPPAVQKDSLAVRAHCVPTRSPSPRWSPTSTSPTSTSWTFSPLRLRCALSRAAAHASLQRLADPVT
jgi:hypothetical protein